MPCGFWRSFSLFSFYLSINFTSRCPSVLHSSNWTFCAWMSWAQLRQFILLLLHQKEHHSYYSVLVSIVGTHSATFGTFKLQLSTFAAKDHAHCCVLEIQLLAKYGWCVLIEPLFRGVNLFLWSWAKPEFYSLCMPCFIIKMYCSSKALHQIINLFSSLKSSLKYLCI